MLHRLRIGLVLCVFASLTLLGHGYLWARLGRDTNPGTLAGGLVGGLLVLLWLAMVLALPLSRTLPPRWAAPLWRVGTGWLGVGFLLVLSLAVSHFGVELFAFTAPEQCALWGLGPGPTVALTFPGSAPLLDPFEVVRTRWAALLGLLLASVLSGLGYRSATGPLALRPVTVRLPGLPPELAGLTIAQLSDLHVGLTRGRAYLADLVARVQAIQPDLVVLTGDILDGPPAELGAAVKPLAELAPPLGVYYVTGNHEYHWGVEACVALLAGVGVQALRNALVDLRLPGAPGSPGLQLAGVDDLFGRQSGAGADFDRALSSRQPGRPVVLLAHQPKAAREASRRGVELMLSGHTHGGQIFPLHWIVTLEQPFLAGLHWSGNTQVYVSRGVGYWGPPLRLCAPPELTLLTLQPG